MALEPISNNNDFNNIRPSDINISPADDTVISGYLYKKTRDGRWQRRWFETNGFYLTYYKSKKMDKLLAALSLTQVGEITLLSPTAMIQDSSNTNINEGLFTIELNNRIYTLRAKDNQEAEKWVNILSKLRDQGAALARISISAAIDGTNRMHSFHITKSNRNSSDGNSNSTPLSSQENNNISATWIKSGKYFCTWCCCVK
mmetsp:Transcript_10164/g.9105  ORF Transcript_10164/g.9105 Transcript_10164/m.9105 type:complete len:201 (-) Transcript_10164:24-626(-)